MPSIEVLQQQGWIKPTPISRQEIQLALERAYEEVAAAEQLLDRFPSSAYELAYNAMLLAVTALLYSDGYRARVERHHKTLTDFAEARLGTVEADVSSEFERARRKRHRTIYGQAKATRREAGYTVKVARRLIALVERLLRGDESSDSREKD